MEVKRDIFLNRLVSRKNNGMVKVITGLRRCGKSYLLEVLYKKYLISQNIREDHIIEIALDEPENYKYHNPLKLDRFIKDRIKDEDTYYIFIDEIQFVKRIKIKDDQLDEKDEITFYSIMNSLLRRHNVDLYVTGSNSKMLSSDIRTEFRGRGDEVHVTPFTFAEFMQTYDGDIRDGWEEYLVYGGLPLAAMANSHEAKSRYLKNLFEETYLKDVTERNKIRKPESLSEVVDVLASSIGSLTNPLKLENTFKTVRRTTLKAKTISSYIAKLKDSFLIDEARRYNIKGRKYISAQTKFYFSDIGLRNARLGFRQIEETHIMENIIFNELKVQGFDVDVGVVEKHEKNAADHGCRKHFEIDFVANRGNERIYIQSALSIGDPEKAFQEKRPFMYTKDSFRKIIIVNGKKPLQIDENGYLIVGILDFLSAPGVYLNTNLAQP